jgi:phage terminase large subunit-like protein
MPASLASEGEVLNLDLQRIIRFIPGYDPYAQAGSCHFDEQSAAFAIDFVQECCRHVKGPKGGETIVLEPWQKAIFANLWGWKRRDGMRRYRECLVYVPRGNSKSTMAACFVCLDIFTDEEAGAELYSSAAEREQARLVFEIVTGMIHQEAELEKRAEVYKYSVVVGDRSYKAISADAGTKHGFNVQLLVNDELHAQRTPKLTEVLMTGMGKRKQPLAIHLTTADFEREGSICNTKHDYAKRVRDNSTNPDVGTNDPAFLPVLYEASTEDDWTSPEVWAKANPNLGVSVPLEYLERECERAKQDLGYRGTFQRLHLNIRTKQRSRWLSPEKWAASAGSVDAGVLIGRQCGGGLDLSSKYDLVALVYCFPFEDGTFQLLPRFWMPEVTATERQRKELIPFLEWAKQGFIELVPGEAIEYPRIEQQVQDDAERYQIERMHFDPWNAKATNDRLTAHGIEMVEFNQNLRQFNEPSKEFAKLILECRMHHGNHPVMNWCAENVEVYTDPSGNIRPVKPKENSPLKIDGIVAGIMALWAAIGLDLGGESYYEKHGIEFV